MLRFRKTALVVLAGLLLPCLSLSAGDWDKEINGLKIAHADGKTRIEISKVGDIEFKAFTMSEPDRLVVDCVGAMYDIAEIDGNSENGVVNRVRTSQYQVEPVLISRIVVDLKKKAEYRMFSEGDLHVIEIMDADIEMKMSDADPGSLPVVPVATAAKTDVRKVEKPKVISAASMGPALPMVMPVAEKVAESTSEPARKAQPEVQKQTSPWIGGDSEAPVSKKNTAQPAASRSSAMNKQADTEKKIMPWPESYVRGAPAGGGGMAMGANKVTIDAQGADIKTVLRTISDFAGVNIVSGKGVEGEIHVHIKDCPWQEALDIILKANGYGYREEFGMIRVAELTTLLREELEIQTAVKKQEELEPLKTRIIFVNNSNAEELRGALESMLTSTRATIEVDPGSNSLIVRDIEKSVEKISEMVRDLDVKTHQVDINAKLVEIDVEASQELGINWNMLNIHAAGVGATGSAEVDATIASSIGTVKFGMVRSWGELTALLQMLERTNRANIISNPRITTLDNREASILVGKEIPLIVADEAGNPVTELTKIGIMLRVTPHVNADRTITLDLHPEVSELQAESTAQGGVIIATAEADTRVIVKNGDTAVIGGLIKKSDTEVIRGVPFLKDIPFLGRLFSSKSKSSKKTELVIFVTPTIVE
ncbi:MAG: type IV pilus secretin PilQ [Candidatus Krumholzibacteria bacterium]|nr:type IV pilus secretin PilQ [Candidatus Krumholzibacteria bacterium]